MTVLWNPDLVNTLAPLKREGRFLAGGRYGTAADRPGELRHTMDIFAHDMKKSVTPDAQIR
jgi:hypothetical protein